MKDRSARCVEVEQRYLARNQQKVTIAPSGLASTEGNVTGGPVARHGMLHVAFKDQVSPGAAGWIRNHEVKSRLACTYDVTSMVWRSWR